MGWPAGRRRDAVYHQNTAKRYEVCSLRGFWHPLSQSRIWLNGPDFLPYAASILLTAHHGSLWTTASFGGIMDYQTYISGDLKKMGTASNVELKRKLWWIKWTLILRRGFYYYELTVLIICCRNNNSFSSLYEERLVRNSRAAYFESGKFFEV